MAGLGTLEAMRIEVAAPIVVPLLGAVAAGRPIEAVPNEGVLELGAPDGVGPLPEPCGEALGHGGCQAGRGSSRSGPVPVHSGTSPWAMPKRSRIRPTV